MIELSTATAISPMDGRYFRKVSELSNFFSDFALVKARLKLEIEYFIQLQTFVFSEKTTDEKNTFLREVHTKFSLDDYNEIQEIEKETNHDVKAVEVFLRRRITSQVGFSRAELVHFGLTSQDVNDVVIPYLLREAIETVILPALEALKRDLDQVSETLRSTVFVARTHGQPASPTTFGKEFKVFSYRLENELAGLREVKHYGKFGGATGNFNAHILVYPELDWNKFAKDFLKDGFGLERSEFTTQINNHEHMARIFDNLARICGTLQDFAQDMWLYFCLGLLTLKAEKKEVGSSAMPHKVNPISFENAEGNLQIASAVFSFLSRKLLVSRLQRDLTDYTTKRNIGVPMSHLLLSAKNLREGLLRLVPNEANIAEDCARNFVVIAEGVQSVLRAAGVPGSYDIVKDLVRGTNIGHAELMEWMKQLNIGEAEREKLSNLSPQTYAGNSKCF